jgi:UDP-N-acetyl-D-glucosamine dehydrogenase
VTLLDRIRARQAKVGVIGLGYVGLPLAVELAKVGFDVTGFDVDARKVGELKAGRSYIPDVPTAEVAQVVAAGRLRATTDMSGWPDGRHRHLCAGMRRRAT